MAGRIPKSFIDDLVARSDVVEVVGRRVPLKRAGREYKACCPFHNEKSPSFHVNSQKNFYHCFGCGAHGDALRFIMDFDHCDFVSAVEILASEMGLTVLREQMTQAQVIQAQKHKTETLEGLSLLAKVASWFARNLREHPDREQAIRYLQGRGVSGEIARDFNIGFAPNDQHGLQRAFPQVSLQQWLAIGLVTDRDDHQHRDRFRGRIQFPIRDVKGRVLGFGGRILYASELAPKYLNSPETDFFHKGQLLYGLYELLKTVRHISQIVVVEGYMDVVALAQYGIRNVVGTLGTATGDAHLQLLFKYTKEVVFAFDGDKAGRQAAWKALPIALKHLSGDLSVRFLFLPDADDPDSFVRRVGKEGFLTALDQSLTLTQWLIQGLAMQTGLSWQHQDDVRRLLAQSVDMVKSVIDVSVQYALIQALSQAADMQEWQVEKLLNIRTGLAINRQIRTKKIDHTSSHLTVAQSLASRLLSLVVAYPQLSESWPREDYALFQRFGSQDLRRLLNALNDVSFLSAQHVSRLLLTFEQAQQDWHDGWQQLTCQTIKNALNLLLKMYERSVMNEEQKAYFLMLSNRLRACRHRE